ncbi:MAG: SH3 domain-containing protein, partial [Hyphomicrobiales bacterium]
ITAIALVGVLGSGWLAFGDRQPAPTAVEAGTAAQAIPLKPSYLVSVRAPTPAEQAQRDAMFNPKPAAPAVLDLRPRASLEVAGIPAPNGPLATVLSDVNVRSAPGTDSRTLSVASAGSRLAVVGQENGWTQVTLPEGGNGWIASRFLEQ